MKYFRFALWGMVILVCLLCSCSCSFWEDSFEEAITTEETDQEGTEDEDPDDPTDPFSPGDETGDPDDPDEENPQELIFLSFKAV